MSHLDSWDSLLSSLATTLARPTVYDEIYNPQDKWDEDYNLYRAFDADEAFFTQTDSLRAKHHRALISNFFSRRTISEIQHLVPSCSRTGTVRSRYPVYVSRLSNRLCSWIDSVTY